jgi:hypothetical protein
MEEAENLVDIGMFDETNGVVGLQHHCKAMILYVAAPKSIEDQKFVWFEAKRWEVVDRKQPYVCLGKFMRTERALRVSTPLLFSVLEKKRRANTAFFPNMTSRRWNKQWCLKTPRKRDVVGKRSRWVVATSS